MAKHIFPVECAFLAASKSLFAFKLASLLESPLEVDHAYIGLVDRCVAASQ